MAPLLGTAPLPSKTRAPIFAVGVSTAGMLAFLVALIVVISVGCGSAETTTTGGASTSSATLEAGFSGVTLDGTEVSLSEYRGRPLVLVFMATW
jgi:cytochrome oxidase Cu insertion factor (SCO1/SenC/PrrC family)